jgi:hypothetical protein
MISHFHCPINWNAWLEKGVGSGGREDEEEREKGKGERKKPLTTDN